MQAKRILVVVLILVLVAAGAFIALSGGGSDPTGDSSHTTAGDATGDDSASDPSRVDRKRIVNWTPAGEGSASGLVLESGTDRPLEGVTVRLVAGRPGPDTTLETVTAKDGTFAFATVVGFPAWELVLVPKAPLGELHVNDVSIEAGKPNDLGTLYVLPGFHVQGIVVDELGEPVPGATVEAQPWRPQEERVNVLRLIREIKVRARAIDRDVTEKDGKFELTKLAPGTYDFEVSAAGHRLRIERDVIITPDIASRPMRIVLEAGFKIEGQVFRKDGGPLGGLAVVAFEQPNGDLSELVLDRRFATTDENGAFTVDGLGAGEYMVTVHPTGRPIAISNSVAIPSTRKIEITIGGDCSLEGRVTGDNGVAVANADVYVVGVDRRVPRVGQARTDARGDYRIDGLESGDNGLLMVKAEGYGAHPPDFLRRLISGGGGDLVLKPGENRRDVALGKGGVLRGKVIDRDSEEPIAGVVVSLKSPQSFFAGTPSAVSDEKGEFEVTSIPVGTTVIFAEKEGWLLPGLSPQTMLNAVMQSMSGGGQDTGMGNTVVVSEPGQVIERTVKLVPGSYLNGTVVDPQGTPVPGARVELQFASNGGWLDQLMPLFKLGEAKLTGADGTFRIGAPPPAQAATLVARAPGFLDGQSDEILLRPGESKDGLVVTLKQGAVLEGVVTDSKGKPIAGAQVRYVGMSDGQVPTWALQRASASSTLEDGSYRIANVLTGKLAVQVSHPSYLSASQENVDCAEGKSTKLDWKLDGGAVLEGKVIGSDGRAFAGARVSFSLITPVPAGVDPHRSDPEDPVTDAQGKFRIEGLVAGRYRLTASAEGAAPSGPVEAANGESNVTLRLAPAFVIAGSVRGPDGGPLSGVQVRAERSDESGNYFGARERTATDGSFTLRNLPAGTYKVTVSQGWRSGGDAPNVIPKTVEGVQAGTESVLVEMSSGEVISGVVLSPDGEPIARAWAAAQRITTQEDTRSLSLGDLVLDGKFTLKGLLPGEYRITFYVDGGGNRATVLRAGATDIVVDFSQGGVIRGRVMLADGGTPPAGTTVWARREDGESFDARTDETGAYEIRGVGPGTYTVSSVLRLGKVVHTGSSEGAEIAGEGAATADLVLRPQE